MSISLGVELGEIDGFFALLFLFLNKAVSEFTFLHVFALLGLDGIMLSLGLLFQNLFCLVILFCLDDES